VVLKVSKKVQLLYANQKLNCRDQSGRVVDGKGGRKVAESRRRGISGREFGRKKVGSPNA
jgi:hypothetical protein